MNECYSMHCGWGYTTHEFSCEKWTVSVKRCSSNDSAVQSLCISMLRMQPNSNWFIWYVNIAQLHSISVSIKVLISAIVGNEHIVEVIRIRNSNIFSPNSEQKNQQKKINKFLNKKPKPLAFEYEVKTGIHFIKDANLSFQLSQLKHIFTIRIICSQLHVAVLYVLWMF